MSPPSFVSLPVGLPVRSSSAAVCNTLVDELASFRNQVLPVPVRLPIATHEANYLLAPRGEMYRPWILTRKLFMLAISRTAEAVEYFPDWYFLPLADTSRLVAVHSRRASGSCSSPTQKERESGHCESNENFASHIGLHVLGQAGPGFKELLTSE